MTSAWQLVSGLTQVSVTLRGKEPAASRGPRPQATGPRPVITRPSALTSTWVTKVSLGGLGKFAPEPAHPAAMRPTTRAPPGSHQTRRPRPLPAGRTRTAAGFRQLMPLIVTRGDTTTTPAQSRVHHGRA